MRKAEPMESWLSGRRRTTGNRVTVMSGSRVQIPDSPPVRTPEIITISGVFLSPQHDRSAESGISTIILKKNRTETYISGIRWIVIDDRHDRSLEALFALDTSSASLNPVM